MRDTTSIAVTSRSFSRHPILRAELLERYENVTFNDEGKFFEGNDLIYFLKGHARAITALEKINETILSSLPDLKVISKFGVGMDMLDLAALERHGVRLAWTPGTNSRSVAELVMAFAITLLRHVMPSNIEVRSGVWKQHTGTYLSNKTVGLIGCGNVGKDLITLLKPFNCRILCYDTASQEEFYLKNNVTGVGLEDLLRHSDIVSLHLPLNDSTRFILGRDRLALMKPSAILINTARGNLVDESALKTMLLTDKLAGAAFDVFAVEPPADTELLNLSNFIATPHIGGSTQEAVLAMGRAAIAGLDQSRAS